MLSTFLEFYETLMGFILFRLYQSIGLHYPPRLDHKKESLAGGLDSLLLQFDKHEVEKKSVTTRNETETVRDSHNLF